MSDVLGTPATRRFVEYFGELGQRWGLPRDACRVHALLYLVAAPLQEAEIAAATDLDDPATREALAFLLDYQLVIGAASSGWRTGSDPWDMLASGLEQRRRRELPPALTLLRDCHREAVADGATSRTAVRQIARMLELVEGLAALDAQTHRLSPHLIRGIVGASGRAARFVNRAFGTNWRTRS